MTADVVSEVSENITIQLDNGANFSFSGRQFAGGSWYDEETGVLTRQSLYITPENEQVYVIVSGSGRSRSRRAYRVSVQGEVCTIYDGRTEMTLELRMLLDAVRTLTGLDKGGSVLDMVEESLRAANC